MKNYLLFLSFFLLVATGCSTSDEIDADNIMLRNQKGEFIFRQADEILYPIQPPEKAPAISYPWSNDVSSRHPKITKEYFRCKGSPLNPPHTTVKEGETQKVYDCGGTQKHSLPLRDGKEFVYPVLLELVNYIQDETGHKLVVTCGHRCPEHNAYADTEPFSQYSKHMIGAEASFYVQGLEDKPDAIVDLIVKYYKNHPAFKDKKDYTDFKRYEKGNTNTAIKPWYNKEVFIKIYGSGEGRNYDNRHPYPYVSIQVRHDRDLNENVTYSWDKAFRNYHRW